MADTINNYLSFAVELLKQAGIETEYKEARYLLECAGVPRLQQLSDPKQIVPPAIAKKFMSMLLRRCKREPISHILGHKEFWSMPFRIGPAVLDPRPETECVIECLLSHIPHRETCLTIADFGTGSGCLLLATLSELPNSLGFGLDIASDALAMAKENAQKLNLARRVSFIQSNWGNCLAAGSLDVVLSNPPYIEEDAFLPPEVALYDPPLALYGGTDGLDCYRIILPEIARLLKADGIAVIEIGYGQKKAIEHMAWQASLRIHRIEKDLGGIERALLLKKAG